MDINRKRVEGGTYGKGPSGVGAKRTNGAKAEKEKDARTVK